MLEQEVGHRLHQRLVGLQLPADKRAQDAVRDEVWNFVDDLKSAGWPPERIIVAMKEIARSIGMRPAALVVKRSGTIASLDELLAAMVGWCIDRYYR